MADPRVRELQAALAKLGGEEIVITPWQADLIAERFAMDGNVYLDARPPSHPLPDKGRGARPTLVVFDEIRAWTAESWRSSRRMHSAYRSRMIARRRRG